MIITRFAPTPTGHLHLGHALSALFAAQAAEESGGSFLLRIEDIDPVRCKDSFAADLMEDLRWLGLKWNGPVRRQSEHLEDYKEALAKLDDMGLIYPCFCTRREIEAEIAAAAHAPHLAVQGPDGPVYPGTCRRMSSAGKDDKKAAGQIPVWRLDVAKASVTAGKLTWQDRAKGVIEAHPEAFGDVVLARKDVPTSYHLSVTVDDHLQGVTLVTRGEDLFRATDIHRLLQALLGFTTPEYHHHKLLLNEDGKRYAKRDHAVTLRALRESGKTAEEVRRMAGF
ncbi:MAG: tRNA glutamyl-Q(34) synthetase GluQRS [Alphaproteobacteria bacterium]|nr:tRNA glutamyl-Q(34) synthetase GluQRS [Alphaproteobacteria bacterium]